MSSAGEDRLATALAQQLGAPFVVYRSAAWLTKQTGEEPRDGEADLVVAHPELGMDAPGRHWLRRHAAVSPR